MCRKCTLDKKYIDKKYLSKFDSLWPILSSVLFCKKKQKIISRLINSDIKLNLYQITDEAIFSETCLI
jgi:hypothetical protein